MVYGHFVCLINFFFFFLSILLCYNMGSNVIMNIENFKRVSLLVFLINKTAQVQSVKIY